jgi:hypothetical protein
VFEIEYSTSILPFGFCFTFLNLNIRFHFLIINGIQI